MAKCIKNVVLREKYCQQNREKCAEKLILLLKTDYSEKKKKKNKNGDSHMQVITATLVRH